MTPEEILTFETHPRFHEFIKIRHFDDAAKKIDFPVPNLDSYIPALEASS
jgi:predicted HD phosphohydrolase